MPIGCRPHRNDRWHRRFSSRETQLQSQAILSIDREQVIVHLEARLHREAIQNRNVGKERKSHRRFAREISRDAQQMLLWHDDGRFASEFDHFGDGLRVPTLELLYDRIFADFLRVHYASDSGRAFTDPTRARPFSRYKYN